MSVSWTIHSNYTNSTGIYTLLYIINLNWKTPTFTNPSQGFSWTGEWRDGGWTVFKLHVTICLLLEARYNYNHYIHFNLSTFGVVGVGKIVTFNNFQTTQITIVAPSQMMWFQMILPNNNNILIANTWLMFNSQQLQEETKVSRSLFFFGALSFRRIHAFVHY